MLSAGSEKNRIEFLIKRDGLEQTRGWVESTLSIYCEAVENPKSHASKSEYRPVFKTAIKELNEWLEAQNKQ
jgi:hypothetical protein